jgi:hypothetical protein
MKYYKYIDDRKSSDKCFRVHFRIVFAGLSTLLFCAISIFLYIFLKFRYWYLVTGRTII